MTTHTALIVDDEPDIRDLLEITLTRMGITTLTAPDITCAKKLLGEHKPQLCLTDMNLPDGNGIELVQWIQHNTPSTPVAVITAYGNMDTAIESLKAGAFDFVSKPVELPRLRELVNSALRLSEAEANTQDTDDEPGLLLGKSTEIQKLRSQTRKLARSQAPVFISGESGSGKELVARMIHLQGPRRNGPFIAVNCGAIPSELMESEFFGHKKGSFTGAVENKDGLFRSANGGTLFLDEVADLPLAMQVKLLRAIQEKAVRPVGDTKEVPVDIRVLSATHKNLPELVQEGTFRQDLFYRINVIELAVPPLRERPDDIPLLARHILERISNEYECDPASLTPGAIDRLKQYDFPGNVRELENVLERAFTLCDADQIDVGDLHLGNGVQKASSPTQVIAEGEAEDGEDVPVPDGEIDLENYLESIERQAIEKALEATRWNKTAAAKRLGISFRALRYRLKKLGME
ncbi:sigma-54 dependent transcriptional regulator [Marinobacter sp.]|jgi:two-component system, NtrC family, response regulator PilR|uniref:sigma-54-dependent transcriptional regulator n=1 Tax=Marinobacter sp. TaxID=50741 RepID=UPI000C0FC2CB|nr:sigma-54 dependent transcriptional regulator [Marinobacter sp.]MBE95886.1 sigma-54-dependent Fis family transcriptional regulator [Marinobacter sp.]MBP53981.1 sigma-54-dependent Fis family transcriptional regulator [Marinobacter sp.]PHQ74096.1 MAG: sigma-54-dependent Fis family transcriptional regulator [Marinobacter sp.]